MQEGLHQPGAYAFTDLEDVPHNYVGVANEYVVVNASATGLTFSTGPNLAGYLQNSVGISGGTTLIGGTGVTDSLTLQSTSGVGAAGANINFKVGNNGATTAMTILNNGNVGIGTTSPTAVLHLKAGTTTANTATLKFTAGTLLTALELGALEFTDDGTNGHLYITRNLAGVLTRTLIV